MSQNIQEDPQRLWFALGIWPEQQLSIPAWSTRWVIKSVPLSEKCWIKGVHKEGSQIPSQVHSKSPKQHLLPTSLFFEDNKEWHHNLPLPRACLFPPSTFWKRKNCSNLEVSHPTPVTLLPNLTGFVWKRKVWAVLFPYLIMFKLRLRPSPDGCHGSKGLGGPLVSPSKPGPVFLCSLHNFQPSRITDCVEENWPRDGRKLLAISCPQNRPES